MEDMVTTIDKFVVNTEARLLAVVRTAIQETVLESQEAKPQGKMPVITGFLRSSGLAALNAVPVGEIKGDPKKTYTWTGDALNVVLAKMEIDDTFFWGWTAVYANVQELRNGFLEAALQNWQKHVDNAVAYYRNKDAGK